MRQIYRAGCAKPQRALRAVLVAAFAASAGSSALAEEWRVTPRVEVEEAYNSNVDLAPKGSERSDFITSISPGVSVRGTGRRLSLNFDYDPQQVIFLHESSRNDIRQRFRGFTDAELLEQLLFFEANGSVNQQFINNTGGVGGTTLTGSENLSTVQTYSLGPILRNHLGSFADAETRYRYSAFLADTNQIADTTQQDLSFVLKSGRMFTELGWTLNLLNSDADRKSGGAFAGTSSKHQLASVDTQYALNSTFSLLAGAGYEKIEDPTLIDPPNGPIWNVGFQVRPNSVSYARFTIGERFGGSNKSADVNYQISPSARVTARYLQAIQTTQSLAIDNLSQIGVGPSGGLINTSTGRPFLPGDPLFGLQDSAFRQDRFSLNFDLTSGRNTYSAEIFDENREFDTRITDDTHTRGLVVSWARRLTPLMDFNIGASYARSDFPNQADREDDYYSATSGLSYRLSETARARLSYRRTDRRSTAPGSDLREDFVAVTLSKEF